MGKLPPGSSAARTAQHNCDPADYEDKVSTGVANVKSHSEFLPLFPQGVLLYL